MEEEWFEAVLYDSGICLWDGYVLAANSRYISSVYSVMEE